MFWPALLVTFAAARAVFCCPPCLDQHAEQLLHDRLFQTNLRGPRWTGNENQNTLTAVVKTSMEIAGLSVETLNYTLFRWDPRWWSLSLKLKDGTTMGLPTTGYWPYSGDSGLRGVTAPVHDAGSFGLFPNQSADSGSLNLTGLPEGGSVLFFDNPRRDMISHPTCEIPNHEYRAARRATIHSPVTDYWGLCLLLSHIR
ncbi:hypothetical protein B0H15DRAFT_241391 [Mycena belliarum]|uniref:Uncharacterized protein n=1 Tax=Mycena belliarum TaxID=1033014 RepID=A0AAD6U5F3_9AGAR|nr:hypothetical protein B0H15DRAFT_241391 [Mycena belliae]